MIILPVLRLPLLLHTIPNTTITLLLLLVTQQEVLEKELRKKTQILEKQVADSEEAKAKAEMTLTELTSRPQTETEAQMTYIRKAMDSVRQAHRIRSINISSSTIASEQKIVSLENAKLKLENSMKIRVDEAQLLADEAVKKESSELDTIELLKDSSKHDIMKINKFKDQAKQSQINELAARKEFQNLQNQNKEKVLLVLLLLLLLLLILILLLLDVFTRSTYRTID